MGFKSGCCGLCAWFSMIGVGFYAIIAIMLYRHNKPLIEHKFKFAPDNQGNYGEIVEERAVTMIFMAVAMFVAAIGCFAMSAVFGNQEEKAS